VTGYCCGGRQCSGTPANEVEVEADGRRTQPAPPNLTRTGTRRPAPVSTLMTSSNLDAWYWPLPRRITNLTKYPAADQKSGAFACGIGYSFWLLKYFSKAWLFSAQIDSSCLRLTRCQRTVADQG